MNVVGFLALLHCVVVALLGLYGAHRLWFLLLFRWKQPKDPPVLRPRIQRRVTVQLPIYNERTVVARLLRAVGRLEYPPELLEIQVLDDSTDQTSSIIGREVEALRRNGLEVLVLRRAERRGFKAGALAHGLGTARGELICIFDADFEPDTDFLLRLTGHFDDPGVGLVQARWGHSNRDESLLTRAQATLLDGHFVIEHTVRDARGLFSNFNGTAGIWRREAIESSGGWEHDTLTEDLDLSYRAQLAGWRFVQAPMVVAPAEVPADIAAFKSQQRRWAKGSMQVTRKLLGRILGADQPLWIKLEALTHLTANAGYPLVLLLGLLLPLTLSELASLPQPVHVFLFMVCTVSVVAFYERSQRVLERPLGKRLVDTLLAVMLGIGLNASQTLAVISGLRAAPGSFERTPKRGDAPRSWSYRADHGGVPGMELLLAGWLAWGLFRALRLELWSAMPFLALFFLASAWVGGLSLGQWILDQDRANRVPDGDRIGNGPAAGEEEERCEKRSIRPVSVR